MRDVGIFIWVALLIVGVVGSMVSSLRRQMRASAPQRMQRSQRMPPPPGLTAQPPVQTAQAPPWLQQVIAQLPVPPPRPAAPPPPKSKKPSTAPPLRVEPAEHPALQHAVSARHKLFRDRRDLVRGVIAAEVLGKPRGLSDEYFPR
jgi:hypothetical protein